MKGDPKGKGWSNKGQWKRKMAKGQIWTNGNGNTTWKVSNNWWNKWYDWNCEWWRAQWHNAEPKRPQQWKQDQKLCIATFIFMAGTFETCFSNIRSVAIPIETATCSSRRRIKGRENIGKKEFKTIEGTDITYT